MRYRDRSVALRLALIAGIPSTMIVEVLALARHRITGYPLPVGDEASALIQNLTLSPPSHDIEQVIDRLRVALLILGQLYPTNPRIMRWMALASMLGVPIECLPVFVSPRVITTVRQQMDDWRRMIDCTPLDRVTQGLHALYQGQPISRGLIEAAIQQHDWHAIATWLAHGAQDSYLEATCHQLMPDTITILVCAGVAPTSLAVALERWWWSGNLPWDAFPLTIWDHVSNPNIARVGRAHTAAIQLITYPDSRTHEQVIAAAASEARWAAKTLCATRLRDDCLITAVAHNAWWAANVLGTCPDIVHDHLITAVAQAQEPDWAAHVLMKRSDICDDRLIALAAQDRQSIQDVIQHRPDLCHHPLITALKEIP